MYPSCFDFERIEIHNKALENEVDSEPSKAKAFEKMKRADRYQIVYAGKLSSWTSQKNRNVLLPTVCFMNRARFVIEIAVFFPLCTYSYQIAC